MALFFLFLIIVICVIIAIVQAVLMTAFRFLPYVSYGLMNAFALVLITSVWPMKHPVIAWFVITGTMWLCHRLGDKFMRLKVAFALLASTGCSFLIAIIIANTRLVGNMMLAMGVYALSTIILVGYMIARTGIEYDDTRSILSRVITWIVGVFAFAEYSVIVFALWEKCVSKYGYSDEQKLPVFTVMMIVGTLAGCVLVPLADIVFTKISGNRLSHYDQVVEDVNEIYTELGKKLRNCMTMDNMTQLQVGILTDCYKEYEQLKYEIDFKTGEGSDAAYARLKRIVETTDLILEQVTKQAV